MRTIFVRMCRKEVSSLHSLGIDLNHPEWAYRALQHAHRLALCRELERCDAADVGQPVFLFALERAGDVGKQLSQRELAEWMRLSPATVTASLHSLERLGYIRREADPEDQRRKRLVLTEAGRAAAGRCHRAYQAVQEAMWAGFTPEEQAAVCRSFVRLAKNLAASRPQETEVKA
jgi:DNA-binding MarR family transcriptional regulator